MSVGELMRQWRDLRGRSQFDLSLDSGVSQRHISFIESGRSVPSRQMLLDLAQTLDVPLRDRNVLLLAAGYAPVYPERAWDDGHMPAVTKALDRMLSQNEPYPALVMDRYWNVLMTNHALPRLFNRFVDLSARPKPRNLLHLIFDPAGLRPHIAEWETFALSLIQRVHREAVGNHVDSRTRELLGGLLAYPGVPSDWKNPISLQPAGTGPMIPLGLIEDGLVLRYFSLVTTVGTPQTAAAEELRLESMMPADEATESWHKRGA